MADAADGLRRKGGRPKADTPGRSVTTYLRVDAYDRLYRLAKREEKSVSPIACCAGSTESTGIKARHRASSDCEMSGSVPCNHCLARSNKPSILSPTFISRALMKPFYAEITRKPLRYVFAYVAALFVLWAVPSLVSIEGPFRLGLGGRPWDKSLQWAQAVVQIGAFLLLLIGAFVPVIKWLEDRDKWLLERTVDSKPIAVTDRDDDGRLLVTNLGSAPAANVWLLTGASGSQPIALGALKSGDARKIPADIAAFVDRPECDRHALIAEARPNTPRPYTVTLNVRAGGPGGQFVHGFRSQNTNESLQRVGRIDQYLQYERAPIVAELAAFRPDNVAAVTSAVAPANPSGSGVI